MTDPADAKDKEKENSHPNVMDHDDSEPPVKKTRKQWNTSKSRSASEGVCSI